MKRWIPLLAFFALPACAGADLPSGWEDAEKIDHLIQAECSGSAYDPDVKETLVVTPEPSGAELAYGSAHFRCAQSVEGFARRGSAKVDVLVQPIDMNPSEVAGCDCLYDITISLDGLTQGSEAFTLYRRWDNLNSGNDPVLVGTTMAQIP
jgi:hypothetical protein